ncbi:hypothetical protein [Halobacterium hubeiense]|uniref:hypothetical protein n=1 Tax=Halobacterium hubeiense TaxID=1407499 RepID=UPI003C70E0A8
MTVNSLSCGHCPRDDFDSFDELREHVEDCSDDDGVRSGVTRDCPTCGLVSNRLDLSITPRGQLACPECGEVITTYGVLAADGEHRLVSDHEKRSGHAIHIPSDDHPLVPVCDSKYRQMPDDAYQPVDGDYVDDNRVCEYCRDARNDGDGIDRSHTGTKTATKLRQVGEGQDPDEVGLVIEDDDLIADGCGVLNIPDESYTLDSALQMAEDAQDLAVDGDLERASRLAAEASSQFTNAREDGGRK